jgi:hypothetical protein
MNHRGPRVWALVWLLLSSCNGLADPGIEYTCLTPGSPYTETFEGGYTTLSDRCWRTENAAAGDLSVGGGDLALRHAEAASAGDAPKLLRRIEGDFVIITKAEAASGIQSNFCGLSIADAAGIVVRGNSVLASFLVSPYLDETAKSIRRPPENVSCEDNASKPARALAYAESSDPSSARVYSPAIGSDGEAEIAICRKGNRIAYLYRAAEDPEAAWAPTDWKFLRDEDLTDKTDVVGPGALEVGLTITSSQQGAAELGVEGQFNWVVLLELHDDCLSPLEELAAPEVE